MHRFGIKPDVIAYTTAIKVERILYTNLSLISLFNYFELWRLQPASIPMCLYFLGSKYPNNFN